MEVASRNHKVIVGKYVAGIELMNAAQGIEFRRPLKSSPYIESVLKAYREVVPFVEDDVVMADYIADTMRFLEKFEVDFSGRRNSMP